MYDWFIQFWIFYETQIASKHFMLDIYPIVFKGSFQKKNEETYGIFHMLFINNIWSKPKK